MTARAPRAGIPAAGSGREAAPAAPLALPDEATLEAALALLRAVADGTRLRLLAAMAGGERRVSSLAAAAGTSESAVSHQLRALRDARLVAARRDGRNVYYRLQDGHVLDLIRSALEHAREEAAGESALRVPHDTPALGERDAHCL